MRTGDLFNAILNINTMGKEWVVSRNVFIFRTSGGVNLVYNALTNSFLEVSDDVYNVLNKGKKNRLLCNCSLKMM